MADLYVCPVCKGVEEACSCAPLVPRQLTLTEVFEEIGVAIAAVEADANAHGLTGQSLGARDCLRKVAAIRNRVLGTTTNGAR